MADLVVFFFLAVDLINVSVTHCNLLYFREWKKLDIVSVSRIDVSMALAGASSVNDELNGMVFRSAVCLNDGLIAEEGTAAAAAEEEEEEGCKVLYHGGLTSNGVKSRNFFIHQFGKIAFS